MQYTDGHSFEVQDLIQKIKVPPSSCGDIKPQLDLSVKVFRITIWTNEAEVCWRLSNCIWQQNDHFLSCNPAQTKVNCLAARINGANNCQKKKKKKWTNKFDHHNIQSKFWVLVRENFGGRRKNLDNLEKREWWALTAKSVLWGEFVIASLHVPYVIVTRKSNHTQYHHFTSTPANGSLGPRAQPLCIHTTSIFLGTIHAAITFRFTGSELISRSRRGGSLGRRRLCQKREERKKTNVFSCFPRIYTSPSHPHTNTARR